MRVQFVRWGNSLALRIPNAYAKDLDIHEGADAELAVENGRLVATPLAGGPVYDLDSLLSGITDDNLHAETATGPAVGAERS